MAKKATSPPSVRVAPLEDFYPNAANPRIHDDRNLSGIGGSLDQFGPGRSLVAGPDQIIYCGNGTYQEALKRGMQALVVRPERDQIVIVERPDLSITEAVALGIADNRLTDLSQDDTHVLAQLIATLPDAEREATGWTEEEIRLMSEAGAPAEDEEDEGPDAGGSGGSGSGAGKAKDQSLVPFRFGLYSGMIEKDVYESFVSRYKQMQAESGEPMMTDVLRAWLDV